MYGDEQEGKKERSKKKASSFSSQLPTKTCRKQQARGRAVDRVLGHIALGLLLERNRRVGNRLEERYLLTSQLGKGGLGRVFLASDQRLDREVAIKVLFHDRDIAEAEKDLETEARLGASRPGPCFGSGKVGAARMLSLITCTVQSLSKSLPSAGCSMAIARPGTSVFVTLKH